MKSYSNEIPNKEAVDTKFDAVLEQLKSGAKTNMVMNIINVVLSVAILYTLLK